MIWSFIAGMVCGAVVLILLILLNDRTFLDLLAGRLAGPAGRAPEREQPLEMQSQRRVAVGGGS